MGSMRKFVRVFGGVWGFWGRDGSAIAIPKKERVPVGEVG